VGGILLGRLTAVRLGRIGARRAGRACILTLAAAASAWAASAPATSGETAEAIQRMLAERRSQSSEAADRYRDMLESTGYHDDAGTALVPGYDRFAGSSEWRGSPVRDAHDGLRAYRFRACEACHQEHADNLHTARAGNTCRQCHGSDPIASVDYYYSPLNPIRRHAYVCATCHQGASPSFASYAVHQPEPAALETRTTFPVLFYTHWLMVLLLVGVFAVFIPHSLVWWVRELFLRKGKA
jgi:hypothetical protein